MCLVSGPTYKWSYHCSPFRQVRTCKFNYHVLSFCLFCLTRKITTGSHAFSPCVAASTVPLTSTRWQCYIWPIIQSHRQFICFHIKKIKKERNQSKQDAALNNLEKGYSFWCHQAKVPLCTPCDPQSKPSHKLTHTRPRVASHRHKVWTWSI